MGNRITEPTLRRRDESSATWAALQGTARELTSAPSQTGNAAPPTSNVGATLLGWGVVVILALCCLAFFALPILKSIDVVYASAYMFQHRNDSEAFPSGAQFCKGPLCRETQTIQKHVCGLSGRQSEWKAYFCQDHDRPPYCGFFDLSAYGTVFWGFYGLLTYLVTAVWFGLATFIPATLAASPILVIAETGRRGRVIEWLMGLATVVGLGASLVACALYIWW